MEEERQVVDETSFVTLLGAQKMIPQSMALGKDALSISPQPPHGLWSQEGAFSFVCVCVCTSVCNCVLGVSVPVCVGTCVCVCTFVCGV